MRTYESMKSAGESQEGKKHAKKGSDWTKAQDCGRLVLTVIYACVQRCVHTRYVHNTHMGLQYSDAFGCGAVLSRLWDEPGKWIEGYINELVELDFVTPQIWRKYTA